MSKTQLEHNIAAHNKIAKHYEIIHGEIYNKQEQSRLREKLSFAIQHIHSTDSILALDFGCGAGNLTKHLTDLGCNVIAADVSKGFLDLVMSRSYLKTVKPFHLNGIDLSGIETESVHMIAMYSVLHHIPDYLSLMKDFVRVLKKGGIIYIDHESSPFVWDHSDQYESFTKEMKKNSAIEWKKYFIVTNYIDRLIRVFINPKYQREGDIHVFRDDHIEWNKIQAELASNGVDSVFEEDYLVFRRSYDKTTYEFWKNKVQDMHLFIGRKR